MKIRKKISAITLIVALLISVISVGITSTFAVEQTNVQLIHGQNLEYQKGWDWQGVYLSTTDNEPLYCLNPNLPAPPTGSYSTDGTNMTELTSSTYHYNLLRKALYYCYGGEGFNTSLSAFNTDTSKHQKREDGNTCKIFMGNLKYSSGGYEWISANGWGLHYLLTHLTVAYISGYENWNKTKNDTFPDAWQQAVFDLTDALIKAPDVPVTTRLYLLNTGNGYQNVLLQKSSIKLNLYKSSANTDLTDNNNCYSLKDAVYGIYLSKAEAEAATSENRGNIFGEIWTNEKGYGKYGIGNQGADVQVQNYFAKELVAPKGYQLDDTVYTFEKSDVSVDGTPIYSFNCTDIPSDDPIFIRVAKLDSKTGQASDKLKDAEFTVNYYDDFYTDESELVDKKPIRSWVIKTDKNGRTSLTPDYFVSGDEFYYANGLVTLPLGTATVQETKAPEGYQLDETLYIRQITTDGAKYVNTTNIAEDGALIIDEQEATPQTGYVAVHKTDEDTNANVKGAVYGLYNSDKTDNEGNLLNANRLSTATTASSGIGNFNIALLPGTYYVQEITAPNKYVREMKIYSVNITAETTASTAVMVEATDKQTSTEITKTDVTGDKELIGAKLTITDSNNKTVDTWVSDGSAHVIRGLIKGKEYTLTEVLSPDGYVTAESIKFTVNADGSTTKVSMKDAPTIVEAVKLDELGNMPADVNLQIIDNNKSVVADWTTDGKNTYTITGVLIVGQIYKLHEVSAPNNLELAEDVTFTVADTADVQKVVMTDKLKGSVTLYKQDSEGNELTGAEFELYSADDSKITLTKNSDGNYTVSTNGAVTTLATDNHGKLYVDALSQGDYYFVETKSPDTYYPVGTKIKFTVSVDDELNATVTAKNDKIVMLVTGGNGLTMIYVVGFSLLAVAIAVFTIYTIKIRKKHSKK